MSNDWISNLAEDIKQKGHEAAENYGRSLHRAGIVSAQGRPFFTLFVQRLEEYVSSIKRELQGDVTASDTTVQTNGPSDVKLSRSRFPWFDAHITLQESTILLEYAKGLGVAGDPSVDRKNSLFDFHVAEDDTLSVRESFGENPKEFLQPDELARHIVEVLFQV
jgi:hypothetical protein